MAVLSNWVERHFKWIITLPALIAILVTAVVPTVWLIYTSFFSRDLLMGTNNFTGLGNYIKILSNPATWGFLRNTALYVLGSVGVGFFISLIVAKLLSMDIRLRAIFLVLIILPWIFPKIAGAIMWNWMIHQLYGIFNFFLFKLGFISEFIPWLAHANTTFVMLTWVDLWYWTPFAILVIFGGFTRVPTDMLEAAQIDGASFFQVFRHIEFPYILPEILATLLLRTMFTFREFGIPFLMGQGGPGRSTEVLGLTIYKTSTKWLQLGMGSALSVIMLFIMIGIASFYLKTIRPDGGEGLDERYD